jgi:hypothetical protein
MSGDDKDFRERLNRFDSPREVADWGRNAEKMWKQGELPDPFPTEGSPEDQSAWRATHGIPSAMDEYSKHYPEGFTVPDGDTDFVNSYLEVAYKHNLAPDVVNDILVSVYDHANTTAEGQTTQDATDQAATTAAIRDEYGDQAKAMTTAGLAVIGLMSKEAATDFMQSRLPDGTLIVNSPEHMRWLANRGMEAGVTAPAEGSADAKSLAAEKAELETMMKETKGPYYTDAKGKDGMTNHQRRYAEILTVEENMARSKAR